MIEIRIKRGRDKSLNVRRVPAADPSIEFTDNQINPFQ